MNSMSYGWIRFDSIITGAVLTINSHRFKLINADSAVYTYMQDHQEIFSSEAVEGVRQNVIARSGAHLMEEVNA